MKTVTSFRFINFISIGMWVLLTFASHSRASSQAADPLSVLPPDPSTVSKVPIEFKNGEADQAARVLFLRLEPIENAVSYEIQIRPVDKGWGEPYSVKTNRDNLRLRVTPGDYQIRTRSIDAVEARSGWGSWRAFTVPFRQPTEVFPKADENVPSKGELAEKLSFEWPKIPNANAYRFKLYDENKVLLKHTVTKKNWNLETLQVGRSYYWSVVPMVRLDEPEMQGFENQTRFTLAAPAVDLSLVEFKLTPTPRAIQYQFELVKMLGNDQSSPPTIFESREAEFKARLEPGHFEFRVRSIYDDGSQSSWGRPTALMVPIPRPAQISPARNAEVDPTDDTDNKVYFSWVKSKYADRYAVSVYSDGKLLASIETKDNYAVIPLPAGKSYLWRVKAMLVTSPSREPASIYEADEQDSSFSTAEYIHLNLGGAEEPSQLYAWGRFIYSNVNYQSDNFDQNTRIRQAVLALTAEAAGGYWYRKTNYGGLLTAALSGIDVGGVQGSYTQYSALLGYRMSFEGQKRLRFWLGPSLKETPEIIPDGFSRAIQIRPIKTFGATALVAFFNAFTEHFGMQFNGGSFYGMKGLDTPNGLEQRSFISYFASLYGTYKFSRDITSLLGYTYQSDTAGYKSADRSGNDNRMSLAGHYISLSFIFGLQEPQK